MCEKNVKVNEPQNQLWTTQKQETEVLHLTYRYRTWILLNTCGYTTFKMCTYVCIVCAFFLCLVHLVACTSVDLLQIARLPPYRQSPPLFSACYVRSIDVTTTDTTLGFLFSRYAASVSSHLSENQCPKTSSNCTQSLWWPLPMLHQIKCVWPTH